MFRIYENEKTTIVAGKVISVADGKGSAAGKLKVVTIEGQEYNSETSSEETKKLEISYWNSDDSTQPQRADRVEKANLSVGSFIVATVKIDPATPDKATGYDFQYKGLKKITVNEKERCVIQGVIGSVQDKEDKGIYQVSIPVDEYNSETKERETKWITVAFFDGDTSNAASRARKCLFKGMRVVIRCGELKKSEYNGKEYLNLTGYQFIIQPKAEKAE